MNLTAYWGNDDVSATIRISKATWQSILAGNEYEATSRYYYEGKSYKANWYFNNGLLDIHGTDGRDCVLDRPVNELIIDAD